MYLRGDEECCQHLGLVFKVARRLIHIFQARFQVPTILQTSLHSPSSQILPPKQTWRSDASPDSLLCSQDGEPDEQMPPDKQDPHLLRQAVSKARADLGIQPSNAGPVTIAHYAGSERSGKQRLVKVSRQPEIEAARSELPIISMEQEIVEAVLEHDVVVLSGETGCGKTTQVSAQKQLGSTLHILYKRLSRLHFLMPSVPSICMRCKVP